jgi:ribonuclease VapC
VIVDSSALVAILWNEPNARRYAEALDQAASCSMSAATYVETAAVVDAARNPVVSRRLDELIEISGIQVVALSQRQAVLARQAYRDFGKGSGSSARLNLGDCFSYALAADVREPLLFKGDDFTHTDVTAALPGTSSG